jgi:F1F0 ATPase subunit 2
MHDALAGLVAAPFGIALAILEGSALGLVFYAGLWWTVRRAATFRRPGLSVLASLLLRTGVTLAGFYLVGAADWARLLACLLGFVLARVGVTWFTRLPASAHERIRAAMGARHAP